MEMDPIYVQIIINRMKKIGVDAKLV